MENSDHGTTYVYSIESRLVRRVGFPSRSFQMCGGTFSIMARQRHDQLCFATVGRIEHN